MYRILLVDDEKMELEALKNYIDWKTLGIDHVDTAKNGKAAYELVTGPAAGYRHYRYSDAGHGRYRSGEKDLMSGTGILRSSF